MKNKPILMLSTILVCVLFSCSEYDSRSGRIAPPKIEMTEVVDTKTNGIDTIHRSKGQRVYEKVDQVVYVNDSCYYFFSVDSTNTVSLSWGYKDVRNTTRDTNNLMNPEIVMLNYDTCTSEFMTFSMPCGTSCTSYWILPLTSKAKLKEYDFVKAIDPSQNLIVYGDFDSNRQSSLVIVVENYRSSQKFRIIENDICSAAAVIECIRNCGIKGRKLLLEFDGKGNIRRTKTYDLDRKLF